MSAVSARNVTDPLPRHFIHEKIAADAAAGVAVRTRFPPEPNGHLHIGHVKAIWLNFEMARLFGGDCTLRYDDTNPETESAEFERSILEGIRWLGYGEGVPVRRASDYFDQLHDFALQLIRSGKAYVCDLPLDELRRQRGDFNTPGIDSPHRTRTVEENLERFAQMRSGELPDGACSLRARIDMQSSNLYLRDPVLYRIRRARHHRTGDAWCIYPTYDFAHGLSDVIEGVSHSLCTLEFEEHRPLYDFLVDAVELPAGVRVRPRQTEFSRLQLDYTVTSKRRLAELIRLEVVEGWDDPRMPTLAGMQRRGYPPEAVLDLCRRVGVTRQQAWTDLGLLETCVREALSGVERALAVLRPLRVVLTNLPEDFEQSIPALRHPQEESLGMRELLLQREVYIEQSDFVIEAPKGYFRLRPEGEVRLRHAGVIRHTGHDCRADGSVETVYCEFLGEVDRKVKGVVHWV
ncbi:MAG: glutamine--tRNA ligase, partial [Gammaproteobacteria bacterium AqS3]|nr:glutamine--tRNA ligase [Gammaproteobacteria bacterium AqS3]